MSQSIVCTGHPRDMGLAQGRQLRAAIEAAVARAGLSTHRSRWPSLRPLVSGTLRGSGPGRELFRHFAHQAERLEGLAQAANLPLDSLLELQLRMGSSGGERGDLGAGSDGEEGAWIVRESRPVVGFRSLELTRPWLVFAIAGVNAAGLAVMVDSPGSSDEPDDRTVRNRKGNAPSALLVQDCLARFENLAGAVDWCCKRPIEGDQVLVLGDATGARATVVVSGRMRRVEQAASGAGPTGAASRDSGTLVRALGTMGRSGRESHVQLDPIGRRLRLEVAGAGVGGRALDFGLALPAE